MKCFFRTAFLVLFSITISTVAFAQDGSADQFTAKAKEMEQKAMDTYVKTPDSAVSDFRKAADLYVHVGNYKAAAACLQNAAYVQDDYKKDNFKAAELMREARVNWRKTTDTLMIANAYKYTVMQHAKFNDGVTVAKMRDTAITFFTALNDYKSISDMYLTTATMFEGQRVVDSAIKYAALAREISNKTNHSKVSSFQADNLLFRVYVVEGHYKEAKSMIKKLQKGLKTKDLSDKDKMPFYYYAWVYYEKNNDTKKAAEYKTQYDALKNSVK